MYGDYDSTGGGGSASAFNHEKHERKRQKGEKGFGRGTVCCALVDQVVFDE